MSRRQVKSPAAQRHFYATGRSLDAPVSGKRLASIKDQLLELRRQLDAELSADGRQAALGAPCTKHADCQSGILNSHCETQNFTCTCLPQHVPLNSTTCLPRKFQAT